MRKAFPHAMTSSWKVYHSSYALSNYPPSLSDEDLNFNLYYRYHICTCILRTVTINQSADGCVIVIFYSELQSIARRVMGNRGKIANKVILYTRLLHMANCGNIYGVYTALGSLRYQMTLILSAKCHHRSLIPSETEYWLINTSGIYWLYVDSSWGEPHPSYISLITVTS